MNSAIGWLMCHLVLWCNVSIKSKIIIHDSDKEEAESSEESNSPTADASVTRPIRTYGK